MLSYCPFCGSEGVLNKLSNAYEDVYKVTCNGSNDSSCIAIALNGYVEYEQEAVDAWNKRFMDMEG